MTNFQAKKTLHYYLDVSTEPQDFERRQRIRSTGLRGGEFESAMQDALLKEGLIDPPVIPEPLLRPNSNNGYTQQNINQSQPHTYASPTASYWRERSPQREDRPRYRSRSPLRRPEYVSQPHPAMSEDDRKELEWFRRFQKRPWEEQESRKRADAAPAPPSQSGDFAAQQFAAFLAKQEDEATKRRQMEDADRRERQKEYEARRDRDEAERRQRQDKEDAERRQRQKDDDAERRRQHEKQMEREREEMRQEKLKQTHDQLARKIDGLQNSVTTLKEDSQAAKDELKLAVKQEVISVGKQLHEDLTDQLNTGFTKVEKGIEGASDSTTKQLGSFQHSFDTTNTARVQEVQQLTDTIHGYGGRVTQLSQTFGNEFDRIGSAIGQTNTRIGRLDSSVGHMQASVNNSLDGLRSDANAGFANIMQGVGNIQDISRGIHDSVSSHAAISHQPTRLLLLDSIETENTSQATTDQLNQYFHFYVGQVNLALNDSKIESVEKVIQDTGLLTNITMAAAEETTHKLVLQPEIQQISSIAAALRQQYYLLLSRRNSRVQRAIQDTQTALQQFNATDVPDMVSQISDMQRWIKAAEIKHLDAYRSRCIGYLETFKERFMSLRVSQGQTSTEREAWHQFLQAVTTDYGSTASSKLQITQEAAKEEDRPMVISSIEESTIDESDNEL